MSLFTENNAINTSTSIINEFLMVVAKNFNAHSAVLFQQNSGTNHSKLIHYYSESKSIVSESVIVVGKGLVGWVLKNKEPLIYHVQEPNLPNLGYYGDETEDKVRSFMGIPISENLVLCLDSLEKKFFSDEKLANLEILTRFIPQLMEIVAQKMALSEMEKYFGLLEQLSDLKKNYAGWSTYLKKLLNSLSLGTGFEYVAFATLSEKRGHYIVEDESPNTLENTEFSLNSGIVGWVFRNNMTVQSDGKRNQTKMPIFGNIKNFPEFASSSCVPILIDRNTVAVIVLASMSHKELSNEFKLFIRLVTEDLAQFLEVVTLRYRIRKEKVNSIM